MENLKYTLRNLPVQVLEAGEKTSRVLVGYPKTERGIKVGLNWTEQTLTNAVIFDAPIENKPTCSNRPDFLNTITGFESRSSRQLIYLYEDWIEGKLDLSPNYQRDFVWTVEQQQSYLKAVFDERTKPTVHLVVEVEGDFEKVTEEVLDGKQRLTTLFNFLENKVSLPCDTYFKDLGHKDILFITSLDVYAYVLRVMQYSRNLTNQEKLEIFLMINEQGTRLTESDLAKAKSVLSQ